MIAPPNRGLVFAGCAIAAFADGYDVQALGLAIPPMAAQFGLLPMAFAIAASASLIGMALGAMLLSSLADRLGGARALALVLLLIAVATLGALTSRGPASLAAWRFFSGLGLGAAIPIAIALTSQHASPDKRRAIVTLIVTFTAIGALCAGLIAPVLNAHGGWQAIFSVGAALPVIGAALLGGAASTGTSTPAVAGAPASPGVASLLAPATRRLTLLVWGLFWFNLMVNYSLISWVPTLLVQAGWALSSASRASGLVAIGGVAGSLIISLAADRGWEKPALLAAYLLAAAALASFAFAPASHALWAGLLIVVGLTAFGAQLALGAITALRYPVAIRGTGAGWSSGIGRFGAFVGPAILAMLMARGASAPLLLGLLLGPMLLCAILVSALPRSAS